MIVSIIVCSLNRWNQIKASISTRTRRKERDYFLNASNKVGYIRSRNPDKVRSELIKILHKNHYSVQEDNSGGNTFLTADKNRFSPLGTYLIHLSLVLFIIGFLIGSYLGFRDTSLIVAEGETREVGNGTGLALNLESFKR